MFFLWNMFALWNMFVQPPVRCGIFLLGVLVVSFRIKSTKKVAHFPPNSLYLKKREAIRSWETLWLILAAFPHFLSPRVVISLNYGSNFEF